MWAWHVPYSPTFNACKCRRSDGVCSRTNAPHVVLGPSLTKQAQAYSWSFAFAVTRLLHHAHSEMMLRTLCKRFDGCTKEDK